MIEDNKSTVKEALEFVQVRMGHSSLMTTERYLSFRSRLKIAREVQDGWESALERVANRALQSDDG